jgi:hypothetical protein
MIVTDVHGPVTLRETRLELFFKLLEILLDTENPLPILPAIAESEVRNARQSEIPERCCRPGADALR